MERILRWWNSGWYEAIDETQRRREERFEQARNKIAEYGQSPAQREKIRSLSLIGLAEAIHLGQFTAVQVLYAYAYYALEAHSRLNCICEFLLESFAEAEALDEKYKEDQLGKEKLPLFGIPFSVKANFNLKGYDCCIGNASLLNNPCTKDCTLVTHLRSLGAIPFCMTNVPQTLISFACSNPVYGTTGNHHNPTRTPGGSSGGDATLLAANGTPFSTGGDIGGSLRIPAHFCGVTTLKPCQARYEIMNAQTGVPGHGRLGLATGLFTRTTKELDFLLEHILGSVEYHQQLCPRSAPMPLKMKKLGHLGQKAEAAKYRIGYLYNDGFIKPTPACAHAVERAVATLRQSGHEMIRFQIPDPYKAASLFFRCINPDGGELFRQCFAENPVDPYLKKFALMLKVPRFIRTLLAYPLDWFSPQLATILRANTSTPAEVRQTNADLDEYVQKFTEEWNAARLDLLIVPAFPVPAVPFDTCTDLVPCAFATGLYNMLDFPAGVLPIDRVKIQDDKELQDEAQWATEGNILYKQIRDAAANSKGLPVGVQIVGLPWEEEKCLALMDILEEKIRLDDELDEKAAAQAELGSRPDIE